MNVVVNGTFDILHVGHIKLLEFAKSFPDSNVLVLIDSDQRVKELKGIDRPLIKQDDRVYMLQSLKWVDSVKIFNSDQELADRIKEYQPDAMIKGSDYKDKKIIGAEFCKQIIFFDRIENYSTTKFLEKIKIC
jgi:D-beta-D-heptose 7-phosphate kinase/D-beta-D-heptose 1-phosphate adenosyltransferase